MKQFKRIFSSLLVLTSLLCTKAMAQSLQVVAPVDINASVNEIKNLFGDMINVSTGEIKDFYLQHWDTGDYSANCSHPNSIISEMDNDHVTFKWGDIQGASGYYINYLRLSDGFSETFTTNDNHITLDIPHDLYLVTFQSKCAGGGGSKSALDIIIIERPITFTEKNCNCPRYTGIWSSPFAPNQFTIPTYAWNPSSTYERYYCIAKFDPTLAYPSGITASFRAEIQFDGNTPQTVSMYPVCMTNVSKSADEGFIYAHVPGDPSQSLGVFTFVADPNSSSMIPVFAFASSYDAPIESGRIKLYKCKDVRPQQRHSVIFEDNPTLREVSNSFDSNKTIEYTLPEDNSISILLFDNQGKLYKTIVNQQVKEAGIYQQQIDLTNLPNGLFFCMLKTAEESIPLKLLKVD